MVNAAFHSIGYDLRQHGRKYSLNTLHVVAWKFQEISEANKVEEKGMTREDEEITLKL